MDATANNILFVFVSILSLISSAISFRCYVCSGCPYRLNLTSDKYIIKDGCSKCLLTTKAQDLSKTNRVCLSKEQEQYFETIGIHHYEGCSNISQIPRVTEMKRVCFCAANLCNSSFKFNVKPVSIWILQAVCLFFQYS